MIATVTNQGKTRWMTIDEASDTDKLIEFLKALIKDASENVVLILDNLRVHHSNPFKAWAASLAGLDQEVGRLSTGEGIGDQRQRGG